MTLVAHSGTHRVSEDAVKAARAPEWTKTWHPVSHGALLQVMEHNVQETGLEIKSKQYSMSRDGRRMFGSWTLDGGTRDIGWALGFRNSTNKSLLLGICSGTDVFVCDNLCFSGEFITMRKHTSGLDFEELDRIGREALGGAIIEMEKMVDWQNGLQEIYVPKTDRKELVYNMATKGVFSPGQLNNYLSCLQEELTIRRGRSLDNAHSLYNLHGAATRLMRRWNIERITASTKVLNGLCDEYLEQRRIAA